MKIYVPTLPLCTHYDTNHIRCTSRSTHYLVDFDGNLNPGSMLCEAHVNEVIEELQTKLDETWSKYELTTTRWEDESLPIEIRKTLIRDELNRLHTQGSDYNGHENPH